MTIRPQDEFTKLGFALFDAVQGFSPHAARILRGAATSSRPSARLSGQTGADDRIGSWHEIAIAAWSASECFCRSVKCRRVICVRSGQRDTATVPAIQVLRDLSHHPLHALFNRAQPSSTDANLPHWFHGSRLQIRDLHRVCYNSGHSVCAHRWRIEDRQATRRVAWR
jgi:hypothetical protein